MISIVDSDKIDVDLLDELGIKHIVYKAEDKEEDNIAQYFEHCNSVIEEEFFNNSNSILVHCKAGVSRSACLIMSYLIVKFKLNFRKSYDVLVK